MMPDWLNHSQYLVAFITGLLGGVHCFGMCGGIVGVLTLSSPIDSSLIDKSSASTKSHTQSFIKPVSRMTILLGYNTGRILGYVVAGAIVAFIGSSFVDFSGIENTKKVLSAIASIFMIVLGLYLAGIWNGISTLENVGSHLWKRIQPFTKQFIPVRNLQQAVPLGFLWGWLPCGLVYTALIWTLSAGSALEGALIMLFFGLGTLPNLLAIGVVANRLAHWVKNPKVRLLAGMLVVVMGVATLLRAF